MSAGLHAVLTTPRSLFGRRQGDASRGLESKSGTSSPDPLAVLSLEISQTAASVAGLAEALSDERTCEPLGLNQGRAVQGVLIAARRLMALAHDLTDEAAPKSMVARAERLDLVLALQGACSRQARRLDEAGVRLMGPGPTPGPALLIPAAAVEFLLDGLIAASASLAGPGGALMLETRQAEYAVAEVRIIGAALDQDHLRDSLAPGGELAVWRRAALRCGGDIRVRSSPDEGAVVSLMLPRAAGFVAPSSPLPRFEATGGVALLVGASTADRTLMRLVCSAMALSGLHFAETAEAGLAMARELHPEVVILDLTAPRTDGVSFARRLAEDDFTRGARRLALGAGDPTSAERRRLREAGYRHVLSRPLEVSDLAHALYACLRADKTEG